MTRRHQVRGLWIVAATLALAGCGGGSGTKTIAPSFTLSAGPANANVGQGGSATTTITVISQNGFSSSVALTASGLPAGVTASFNPASTTTTSVMTLMAAGNAATGTTAVTVIGTSGSLAPTTPVNLTVAAPSVTVKVSPQLAAVAATTQTQPFTPTVTGNMGNSNVTWSVDSIAGGNPTVGTISASGLYTPPATGGTHTVTATSVALSTASASASVAVTDLPGVFTYHNDLSRDGANTQEYALTSSTVNTSSFGKLFSCPVDGAVYTQPLWVPGVTINGAVHNVIYVATQHDSVFAFDADASPCVRLWQASLLDSAHGGTSGERPVVWQDVGYCYGDIYPEVGVTGTPVIDPSSGTIYMVSQSEIPGPHSGICSLPAGSYFHKLHALDITTGNEKFNAPVTIAATVPGTGDGSSGGMVTFTSQLQHNRSGLALAGQTVYVAFAAHEDAAPYHGWLFGYSTATSDLTVAPSVFNTTPNGVASPNGGADGGIWGGGGAPAVDSEGNVYVATGNGVFDQGTGMSMQNDYGDSVLNLSPAVAPSTSMTVNGWFSPDDEYTLEGNDTDLGSGAPVLLADQTVGPKHLLVQLGKDGVVYLIDRDSMGFFNASTNHVVQYFQATSGFWGTPTFWQNNLYFAGAGDVLRQFTFDPSTGLFNPTSSSQSSENFGFPDVSPSVSSEGANNGIVWGIDAGLYGYASPNAAGGVNCYVSPVPAACTGAAILHAYSAANLAEYWNSTQAANNRDEAGNGVKFVPPTIANGKVYVSTRTEVDVYGLLPN
ncbi:MAG TPA: hypothetical protein VKF84_04025 [Candidatus Sulfotelmatobacter sp.]|nr:hypothetical protein [Candidatus Sulfotelmatobacter sp.]